MRLVWKRRYIAIANTAETTQSFGNLLSYSYRGEVDKSNDGRWNAWVFCSNKSDTVFCLGLKSKATAKAWVRRELSKVGV